MNEIILISSLAAEFGLVLLAYRLFGKSGLYAMCVFCTLAQNIEVLILISAFGLEQTLGNILFACTFLITDILSENHGKKTANKAAGLSIFTTAAFMLLTQSWLLYVPAADDTLSKSIHALFSNSPRIMLSSLAVCAVTQLFDVWLYHRIWELTRKRSGDSTKFLWLRNNLATLMSQLINTVLFSILAFAGTYPPATLVNIIVSSYAVFIVTSLCDTPVVYIARKMKKKYNLD